MPAPTPWLRPTRPTTAAALLDTGVTKRMITTAVSHGDLVRLRRGVYLARASWPDDPAARHLLRARAEVAANPSGVLSHQSAALAWGMPSPGRPWEDLPVAITLPSGTGVRAVRAVGEHHTARLPPGQVITDADGTPVTSPARTVVDLADGLGLPEALVLFDAAARLLCAGFVAQVRRQDYTNPHLADAAREHLREVAGSRRRTSLAASIALAEPCRESAAESLSAGHFALAGLPRPEYQAPVRTPAGLFFPDCLWRAHGVIGECDGAVKYADPRAYVREKQREQVFRDLGFQVVRWLAEEIMFRPWEVVARVDRALAR